MTNPYYTFTPRFIPFNRVKAEEVNNQLDAIVAAFDLLPPNSGSINIGTATLGVESGSGDAYVVTMPSTRLLNSDGDEVVFKATHQNSGAATLQVDAVSAVPLVRYDGTAVQAGDILSGTFYTLRYNATAGYFLIVSPALQTIVGALTYAAPSVAAALTAAAGTAITVLRSDARIAIDQSIAPTMTGLWTFTNTGSNTGSVIVSNVSPTYGWNETDAAADTKRWRLFASAGVWTLGTLTDADTAGANAIAVTRTGTAITNIALTGTTIALTGTNVTINGSESLRTGNAFANPTGTIGLSVVNGVATTAPRSDSSPALSQAIAPTWTAKHTFSLNGGGTGSAVLVSVASGQASYGWANAAAAANEKNWDVVANSTQLLFRTVNDASNSAVNWAVIDRTGTVVDSIAFAATAVLISGATTFTGGTDSVPAVLLSNTSPILGWNDTNASADEKNWRMRGDGNQWDFFTLNDAGTVGNTIMNVARSGATVSTITVFGTNFSIGSTNLTSGAVATWSEQHTFTKSGLFSTNSNGVHLSSAIPLIQFTETGAAANNKRWALLASGETFSAAIVNDAGSSSASWLTVDRTGAVVDQVLFPTDNAGTGNFKVGTLSTIINGSLIAARTASTNKPCAQFSCVSTGIPTILVQNEDTTGDNVLMRFSTDSNNFITVRGSITYNRAGGVLAFNTTSGSARKKNIRDSDSGGAVIDAIRVRGFEWIDGPGKMDWWVVAEELQEVFPVAVMRPNTLHGDWGVDVSKLIPLLVKEVQELRVRMAALEGR